MSVVATAPREAAPVAAASGPCRSTTLEDALVRAWDDLASGGRAECLVCGGEFDASPAFAVPPAVGECQGCGSSIS